MQSFPSENELHKNGFTLFKKKATVFGEKLWFSEKPNFSETSQSIFDNNRSLEKSGCDFFFAAEAGTLSFFVR